MHTLYKITGMIWYWIASSWIENSNLMQESLCILWYTISILLVLFYWVCALHSHVWMLECTLSPSSLSLACMCSPSLACIYIDVFPTTKMLYNKGLGNFFPFINKETGTYKVCVLCSKAHNECSKFV